METVVSLGHQVRPDAGSTSLEVRWIVPGLIPDPVLQRLGPFAEPIEEREDRYLVDPYVPELGVKIRGSLELDLKAYRGSPGELHLAGIGRGRMELWEKWRFSLDVGAMPPPESPQWMAIGKVRRRRTFALEGGAVRERPLSQAWRPGCAVELTEVTAGEAPWWTLAFEATGATPGLEDGLRHTAAHMLREPLSRELGFDPRHSMSYVRWIGSELEPAAATASR